MRLEVDAYFLKMAELVALRSTCKRRAVGCVLVDKKNHVTATGYNGVPKGFTHCIDYPCKGADAPSGTRLNECKAVHAEMNALLQLQSTDELTAYLTVTPCFDCAKVLANSNVTRIVASVWYPQTEVKDILEQAHIIVDIPMMVSSEKWDCQP
jgi:dCMP deaminase